MSGHLILYLSSETIALRHFIQPQILISKLIDEKIFSHFTVFMHV